MLRTCQRFVVPALVRALIPVLFLVFVPVLLALLYVPASAPAETEAKRADTVSSEIVVIDDSPDGFKDLSHAYTMFAPSLKKNAPQRRGRFNQGEKSVLALCDEASITSTTGQVLFTAAGRRLTRKTIPAGTEFRATLRLTIDDWETIGQKVQTLLPDVATFYNGVQVPTRHPLASFNATLPTVLSDEEGNLRGLPSE